MKHNPLLLVVCLMTGVGLISQPANSFLKSKIEDSPKLEGVLTTKTLNLAAVKGNSTFFSMDGFEHGFGYDLARVFADDLGVSLKLKVYDDDTQALQAVKQGDADIALTTASPQLKTDLSVASVNLSCGHDAKLTDNSLHPNVSWAFSDSNDLLAKYASHYLCQNDKQNDITKLANFYNQNVVTDEVSYARFKEAMTQRLPQYKASFQKQAAIHEHDWELLVAIGYQESHLQANATSPTGVRGIMMLTNDTSEEVGVEDRLNPHQSIRGGAKYLQKMEKRFTNIPEAERTWFILASYNMGPNAVKDVQKKLVAQGKDGNSWENVYAYMYDHQASNSRYTQCMHYVSNIKTYLEAIKTIDIDA